MADRNFIPTPGMVVRMTVPGVVDTKPNRPCVVMRVEEWVLLIAEGHTRRDPNLKHADICVSSGQPAFRSMRLDGDTHFGLTNFVWVPRSRKMMRDGNCPSVIFQRLKELMESAERQSLIQRVEKEVRLAAGSSSLTTEKPLHKPASQGGQSAPAPPSDAAEVGGPPSQPTSK